MFTCAKSFFLWLIWSQYHCRKQGLLLHTVVWMSGMVVRQLLYLCGEVSWSRHLFCLLAGHTVCFLWPPVSDDGPVGICQDRSIFHFPVVLPTLCAHCFLEPLVFTLSVLVKTSVMGSSPEVGPLGAGKRGVEVTRSDTRPLVPASPILCIFSFVISPHSLPFCIC